MNLKEQLSNTISTAEKELLQLSSEEGFDKYDTLAKLLVEAKQILEKEMIKLPDLQKLSLVKNWNNNYETNSSWKDITFNVYENIIRVYYPKDIISFNKKTVYLDKDTTFLLIDICKKNGEKTTSIIIIPIDKEWGLDDYNKLANIIENNFLNLYDDSYVYENKEKNINSFDANPNLSKLNVQGFSFVPSEDKDSVLYSKYVSDHYDDETFTIKYLSYEESVDDELRLFLEYHKHNDTNLYQGILSVKGNTIWDKQKYGELSKKIQDLIDTFKK